MPLAVNSKEDDEALAGEETEEAADEVPALPHSVTLPAPASPVDNGAAGSAPDDADSNSSGPNSAPPSARASRASRGLFYRKSSNIKSRRQEEVAVAVRQAYDEALAAGR